MSKQLTNEEIRAIILSTNENVRNQFLQYFGSEVDDFVSNLTGVYDRMQEMARRVNNDRRSAWADEFLFTALNSLLTSFHLVISGLRSRLATLCVTMGKRLQWPSYYRTGRLTPSPR